MSELVFANQPRFCTSRLRSTDLVPNSRDFVLFWFVIPKATGSNR